MKSRTFYILLSMVFGVLLTSPFCPVRTIQKTFREREKNLDFTLHKTSFYLYIVILDLCMNWHEKLKDRSLQEKILWSFILEKKKFRQLSFNVLYLYGNRSLTFHLIKTCVKIRCHWIRKLEPSFPHKITHKYSGTISSHNLNYQSPKKNTDRKTNNLLFFVLILHISTNT